MSWSIAQRLAASSWTSLLAGVLASVVAFSAFFLDKKQSDLGSWKVIGSAGDPALLKQYASEVSALRTELKEMRSRLDTLSKLPEHSKTGAELAKLSRMMSEMQSKQAKIEQAILSNPAKALEIPLMQRDLESLRSSQQASAVALKDAVDRVYDLNKWLLGAMAVSVLSLALGTFLRRKPE
jgi:hypothetical protein